MKIAIEAQRIFRTAKHGMDFVALEVIRRLQKLDHENEYFIMVSPGEDHCLEESTNMHIVEVKCPTYPLWEQVALPLALRRIKPDILHCTSNTAPIFCNVPLVLTLHDIIFLEPRAATNRSLYQTMGWYYRRLVVPRILPKCRKIITVSNFECQRIREALALDPSRITAIYNGFNSHFKPVKEYTEITKKYLPQEHYLFFLGNTDPKKNTLRTLRAYSFYLEKSEKKLPLLIADLHQGDIDVLLKEGNIEYIREKIIPSGYILNSDLPAIYSGAQTFIYTSLRESFGIPILESMACGTPIVTSNTSAMPEIAGSGAMLAEPTDENSIAGMILALECDKQLHQQQSEYGLERVKAFSWEQTAEKVLEIYQQLDT